MPLGPLASQTQNAISKQVGAGKRSESEGISRQVRRFLSDAYAFLSGLESQGDFGSYGLDQAISDRIGEIDGTPRNPSKLNRIKRIDRLLANADSMIAKALTLSEEDLSADIVSGLGATVDGVEGYFGKAMSVLDQGPSALTGDVSVGSLTDKFGGSLKDASPTSLMKGSSSNLPKISDDFPTPESIPIPEEIK